MNNNDFEILCRKMILSYYEENKIKIDKDTDIFVVWISKALQNNKALLATTVKDNLYFEITFNGDKKQCYLDVYNKILNTSYDITFSE